MRINGYGTFKNPLTNDETIKYFKLYKGGDKNAFNILVEHNLKSIIAIINSKYKTIITNNPEVDLEDLFQIGCIGLIKSIKSFDIDKGNTFMSYSYTVISNEILKYFRLRENKQRKFTISIDKYVSIGDNGNKMSLGSTIDSGIDITENYNKAETELVIKSSFNLLNDIEKKVTEMYFGFNCEKLSQEKIGQILGYSKAYISKIINHSLKKISKYLEKNGQGNVRTITKEYSFLNDMTSDEVLIFCAKKIINENYTTKDIAKILCKSNQSIIKKIDTRLITIDNELYRNVKETIKNQKEAEINKKLEYKKR